MCARSVLSPSVGFFIFFNISELGLHFSSLSVLLCLIQIEIIGGWGLKPPSASASDGLETGSLLIYYTLVQLYMIIRMIYFVHSVFETTILDKIH